MTSEQNFETKSDMFNKTAIYVGDALSLPVRGPLLTESQALTSLSTVAFLTSKEQKPTVVVV